jgi:F-type H+-transporting ATPase subunit a
MKSWWNKLGRRGKALVVLGVFVVAVVGAALIPGGKKETYDAASEFVLTPVIRLPKIGPVNLSITKAVIILWVVVVIIVAIAVYISRSLKREPTRIQTILEGIYELAHDGIATSVMRVDGDVWFPYIGGVFVYILLVNLLGLLPLPVGDHGQLSFYAASGNLYFTLPLALCTFFLSHYAGIKAKGGFGYIRGWMVKDAPPVMRQFIFLTHVLGELFRVVSLSVRLFANMLAGHLLLAVLFAMALLFQSYVVAGVLSIGSVAILLFEVFIACIQAFIFAILSAAYIGGAIEEEG